MKALLVTFEFGERVSGGLGRVVNGVSEHLRKRIQLDVFLLYFDPLRLRMAAKLYRCRPDGEPLLLQCFGRGNAARNCVDLLKRSAYDVVHFMAVNRNVGQILELLAAELPQQRIVYSVHSLIKYEQGTRLNPSWFLDCEQRMFESASLVHVLNHTTREYLEQSYPELSTRAPVRVVPNGVEPNDFSAVDAEFGATLDAKLDPNRYTVVCMSRWAHGKGLEHFVRAATTLLEAGERMQFVLAGRKLISWERSWYSYVLRVQRLARRTGAGLTVLGWLDRRQRNTLFQRADVCVVPSELEYYPYSVLEPVAAGVPLVSSDLPCVKELLQDGTEFVSFRSRDSADLADKLAGLARAPERARDIAEGARLKVTQLCDWRDISEQYEAMYRTAAALPAHNAPGRRHEAVLCTA